MNNRGYEGDELTRLEQADGQDSRERGHTTQVKMGRFLILLIDLHEPESPHPQLTKTMVPLSSSALDPPSTEF